jgi:hypothetical protein
MGEQILRHNIRLRDPAHLLFVGSLLNIQHSQTTAYHPQSNDMVERFHRGIKDALRAPCAAANWVDHLQWILLGLRAAAREDNGITPSQAVFGLPLILPGQFLDSPELPSKDFLERFYKTLNAAKHPSTRHNSTSARRLLPQLPDDLARALAVFMRQDGHVPLLQPLYNGPYTFLRNSLNHFTLRISDKEDKVSNLRLNPELTLPCRLHSPGSEAARPPPYTSGISPPPSGAAAECMVYFTPRLSAQRARNCFPLASRQGFLHSLPQMSTTQPLSLPATAERLPDSTSRPPSLRPGGSPVEAHNCIITNSTPTPLMHMLVRGASPV